MCVRSSTRFAVSLLVPAFVLVCSVASFAQCADNQCYYDEGWYCGWFPNSGFNCSATGTECNEVKCPVPGAPCQLRLSVAGALPPALADRGGTTFSFLTQVGGPATIVVARFSDGQALRSGLLAVTGGAAVVTYRLGWGMVERSGAISYQLGPSPDGIDVDTGLGRIVLLQSPGLTTEALTSKSVREVVFFVYSLTRADGSIWTADVEALMRDSRSGADYASENGPAEINRIPAVPRGAGTGLGWRWTFENARRQASLN